MRACAPAGSLRHAVRAAMLGSVSAPSSSPTPRRPSAVVVFLRYVLPALICADRDREDEARAYVDGHGRWPDED